MSKVKFENSKIIIDGKETQIVSGAIHYFRVHPGYWRDRLEKMVMCGFNCLETYMCWNLHEPEEGKFDFSDGLDFVEFIRIAQELGLYVVLRPGPYICAEWDNGGIPYWVLNKPGVIIRRMNEPYLKCVRNFFDKILPMIKPLQYDEGGPIIALQIENEFGSFNRDLPYIAAVKEMFLAAGMTVPLFTADGASDWCLLNGTLPGTQALVTGGSRVLEGFKVQKKYCPDGVPFYMEFWDGWFDSWLGPDPDHHTRSAASVSRELDDLLTVGGHINFYMFHGGTNFGFTAGANKNRSWEEYTPDTTSYDYDAPLNEYGDPTDKFFAIQKVIKKHFPERKVSVPEPVKRVSYGKAWFTQSASLFGNLERIGKRFDSEEPMSFEAMNQAFGFALYRTKLKGPYSSLLWFPEIRDCASVYLDGKFLRSAHRNEKQVEIPVKVDDESVLEIVVENLGRINYGPFTGRDFKGLPEGVFVSNSRCFDWENWSLPMDNLENLQFRDGMPEKLNTPSFYKGYFQVDEIADTFVRFPGKRGVVWVNGFNLGRYWATKTGETLYLPAPVLRKGENEIIVFEAEELTAPYAETVDYHKL